jgi:hypothetical protein
MLSTFGGMRKRYMSAFSYFAVALTLSSLYLFVFRNWFADDNAFDVCGPEAASSNRSFTKPLMKHSKIIWSDL